MKMFPSFGNVIGRVCTGIRRIKGCFRNEDVTTADETVLSQKQLVDKIETGMKATCETIKKLEDECQKKTIDETLNLDDIDAALERVVKAAFKIVTLVHENAGHNQLSNSPSLTNVDDVIHKTIDIKHETLQIIFQSLKAKEDKFEVKSDEVAKDVSESETKPPDYTKEPIRHRCGCPALNALANDSYINNTGTSITVFQLAKAMHNVLQIPLVSAVNLAIEASNRSKMYETDGGYIDLERLRTKPKFHDDIVGQVKTHLRSPRDARLLLFSQDKKSKGIELSSVDNIVIPYEERGLELRVVDTTAPSRSLAIKPKPPGVFRNCLDRQNSEVSKEEKSDKTVSIRVLDLFGLAVLTIIAPRLSEPRQ